MNLFGQYVLIIHVRQEQIHDFFNNIRYNSQKIQTERKKMSEEFEDDHAADLVIEEEKVSLKQPSMYQVVILNDDFTPMEFVVEVLASFFGHSEEQATVIMLNVHQKGKGVCGVFTKDIAETKAMIVNEFSKENNHPLLCEVESLD